MSEHDRQDSPTPESEVSVRLRRRRADHAGGTVGTVATVRRDRLPAGCARAKLSGIPVVVIPDGVMPEGVVGAMIPTDERGQLDPKNGVLIRD